MGKRKYPRIATGGGGARLAWLGAGLALWICVYAGLPYLADLLTVRVLCLSPRSSLGASAGMFFYQGPKVIMLLVLVIFVVGVVRSFFAPARVREILAGRSEIAGGVLAAMLGTVTPYCSCSAVPLFVGFVEAGIPLGMTLSFLIAAPMVNEIAVALLANMFGWKIAGLYVATGLAIAVTAGWVIARLRMERFVEPWVLEIRSAGAGPKEDAMTWAERIDFGAEAVRSTLRKVWPYVLAGVAVGSLIHGFMPADFLTDVMGRRAWWSVPAAVALGAPMYLSPAGVVPVMQALMEKGASLGTALAFMMAVIGISLPEVIILRRVLRPQLIGVFLGVIAVGIMLVGWLFNVVAL